MPFVSGCQTPVKNGSLIYTEKDSLNGFMHPYFLFLPDKMDTGKAVTIVVEPNNTSFTSDDFNDHYKRAKEFVTDPYMGKYLASNLNYPLLVPVFPRSKTDWLIYTHLLDRDVILQKGNSLERLDLQLIAMIENAQKILQQKGYRPDNKVILTGFSASSEFSQRFAAITPERVKCIIAGGLSGLLFMPYNTMNGVELNYPLGTNDFPVLFNKQFDSVSYKKIPQFLFMGANDENDAVPFKDGYDDSERKIVYEQLSEKMMPDRWEKCMNIYKSSGVNATFKTYPGVGHKFNRKNIMEDILAFVQTVIKSD